MRRVGVHCNRNGRPNGSMRWPEITLVDVIGVRWGRLGMGIGREIDGGG